MERAVRKAWRRLAAGIPAPYSCREGARSACCCRVVEGEVELCPATRSCPGRDGPRRGLRAGLPGTAARRRPGTDHLRRLKRRGTEAGPAPWRGVGPESSSVRCPMTTRSIHSLNRNQPIMLSISCSETAGRGS
ncbi:2Fe-2S iron-sulfur cluster-binding protein [Streptomyces sp. NRRL S-448]|uniref:2Fe-2S iron-sulfur cluster-binding protein n=1 Tax=Streptomyces sp. NRRL S-448 TaxID=1463907 RepID=UPI00356387A6